ncbi:LAFE_0B01244g1_1 [Lachancea fermentati]|uniref:LAFE_0B01244g1_1 n=1 Tax=Lachancea fermentati TaxID=4955 RepID=A0A1G4M7B7_LACFM|nr:LAFE_0B01244g1_1 [Lachancea fermentati]
MFLCTRFEVARTTEACNCNQIYCENFMKLFSLWPYIFCYVSFSYHKSFLSIIRNCMQGCILRRSLTSAVKFVARHSVTANVGKRSYLTISKARNPYLTPRNIQRRMEPVGMNTTIPGHERDATLPSKPIVWIDCEMTGLDHLNDHIIEICCIITDGDLNQVDENGYESVVHYGKNVMDTMNEWCIEHHGCSGLTQKVLNSSKTLEQVEQELLDYIKRYIPDERKGILAGNTVHMDRLFMLREFPRVINHLFYRIIDVSSIMEVSFRHNPEFAEVVPKKKGAHTAKSDIMESIAQLKFYQTHYLKNAAETREFVEEKKAAIAQEAANSVEEQDSSATDNSSAKKRKIE